MQLKPAVQWGIVIFLVYFIVQNPSSAGHLVQEVLNWVAEVFHDLGNSFHNLVS